MIREMVNISKPIISLSIMDDIRSTEKDTQQASSSADEDSGKVIPLDDGEVEQFYGSSTTQAYRLKSELVGQCMEEIGMGRYILCIQSWLAHTNL
jgi:hypothetical protein